MKNILRVGEAVHRQSQLVKDQSNMSGQPLRRESLPVAATSCLWSSSDSGIATVVNMGPFVIIEGVSAGDVVITATVPASVAGTTENVVEEFDFRVYVPGTPGAVLGIDLLDA